MVVIDLTKDGFIANVGDFEANPKDWKYMILGALIKSVRLMTVFKAYDA